jgi:hypothetical protein
MRAGAVTEGSQAGARLDDLAKHAGHASKRTTARIYDRDRVEAHRRVMHARVAYRTKTDRKHDRVQSARSGAHASTISKAYRAFRFTAR